MAAAEQECAQWRQAAEAAAEQQSQSEGLRQTIALLEDQQAESRAFELQMARITSTLEAERDILQRQVLKYAGLDVSAEGVHQLSMQVKDLEMQLQRQQDDLRMTVRSYEDKLDAERVLAQGARAEAQYLRGVMGSNMEEIRQKMESGLQLALARVDQMENLLWLERGKSKKYLKLLTELVEQDDLEVLLADEKSESAEPPSQEAEFKFQAKK